MANYTSCYDLISGALIRVGEVADGTSPFQNIALKYLNRINLAMLSGGNEFEVEFAEPWPWAKSKYPSTLILKAPYSTGTVSVTNGSTSGTFSSAPSVSLAGTYLKVDGELDWSRIASHTASTTSFTLDANYTGSTNAATTYNTYYLDYDLVPGILRLIAPMKVYQLQNFGGNDEGKIYGATYEGLLRLFPRHLLRNETPLYFAPRYDDQTGLWTVTFSSYVVRDTRVDYDYIAYPATLVNFQFVDAAVSTGADTITISNHGFSNGDMVMFNNTGGALPTGLTADVAYYVVSTATSTFKVSATTGGSAIDITAAAGGGTHFVSNIPFVPKEHRSILEEAISTLMMSDKNDQRFEQFYQMTKNNLMSMVMSARKQNTYISNTKGKLIPRVDRIPRKYIIGRDIP